MAMDDARLVARARAGDAAAFAALLARHRARLVRACASVLADDAAAADVAQDASLVAWLQLDRLREPGRFGPWLIGIGRNLALGAARERAGRQRRLGDRRAAAGQRDTVVLFHLAELPRRAVSIRVSRARYRRCIRIGAGRAGAASRPRSSCPSASTRGTGRR